MSLFSVLSRQRWPERTFCIQTGVNELRYVAFYALPVLSVLSSLMDMTFPMTGISVTCPFEGFLRKLGFVFCDDHAHPSMGI